MEVFCIHNSYSGPVRNMQAIPHQKNLTLLWCPPFNYSNDGILLGYTIDCNMGELIRDINVTYFTSFTGLMPFTNYRCCIYSRWINDTGPIACINTTTLQDGMTHYTSTMYVYLQCHILAPGSSPVNVSMTATYYSFLIQWEPPLIPNGIITHYTLYINYTNGSEISTRTVDSQFTLYLLEGLLPYQEVGVSISATTGGGEGPQSHYLYNTTKRKKGQIVRSMKELMDRYNESCMNEQRIIR